MDEDLIEYCKRVKQKYSTLNSKQKNLFKIL